MQISTSQLIREVSRPVPFSKMRPSNLQSWVVVDMEQPEGRIKATKKAKGQTT